ncbi:MAG: carboxypeptidase-like regulatory domain-containing protein [Acidobacteriota bacterium]|nr:carboxypeptidase-like regulatory domain-containing protein [Acidobacteriota bacterium]
MTPKSKFVSLFLLFALLTTQFQFPALAAHTEPYAKFDTITGSVSGKVVLGEAGKKFPQTETHLRPPVAGVKARLTNLETGTSRTITTDAKGEYRFPLVPMGNYKVEIFREGYYLVNEDEISQKTVTVKLNDLTKYLPDAQMVQGVKPPPAIAATQTPTPKPTPAPQTAPVAKEGYAGQLANLTDSTRRSNADEQMVALMPLANIRSFDDLATLAAGVAPPPQVKGVAGPGIGAGIGTAGQFSVNGARARSNNFTVDGSDNNDEDVGVRRQGFVALVPQSVESVKEIQIVTHLWDAEHGRSIGSQVNAVSKSGTNQVHGSVYDFFNHSSLNARNFFDYSAKNAQPYQLDALAIGSFVNGQPANTRRIPVRLDGQQIVLPNPSQDKDQFQRNQGGGTIGFPILKERTFFFGSFEQQNIKARQETHFAVPTVAQRGFLGFGATGFTATDRLNRRQTFFPTFIAGDSVMSLFPFPNNPIGPYGENTFTQVLPSDANATIYSLKLDHNFNLFSQATHALTARYNFTDDEKQVPVVGGALFSGVIPSVRTQNLSLFLSSQFSGSRANQFRASYGRTALTFAELRDSFLQQSRFLPQEPYLLNARRLLNLSSPPSDGSPPQFVSYASSSANFTADGNLGPIGQLVVSPFSPLGLDVYLFPQARANNTIQIADTLSLFRAEHSYKFGFDIRRTQLNSFLNRNYRPQVVFGGSPDLTNLFDQAPLQNISQFGPTPGYFSGADLASLGIPTGIFQSLAIGAPNSSIGLRLWQLNFFANDNWRARRGLTLDYGLRYELNTVPREVNSRIENTFALNNLPTADNTLRIRAGLSNQVLSNQDLLNSYTATINSLRQTFNGRDSIFDPDRNNFGGHIGFAWDPMAASPTQSGKTAIRGGIGAYYDLTLGSVVSQSRNVFPNFVPFNADAGSFAYFQQLFFQPGETGTQAIYNPGFIPIDVVNPNGNFTRFPLIQNGQLNAIQLPSGVLPQVLGLLFNPANTNPISNGIRLPSGGGLAYTLPDNNLRAPYTLQFNLQVERELFNDLLLNVAYVGTRGIKLTRFRTPNGGPNSITLPIDPLGLNTNSLQAIALPPLSNIATGSFQRPNPNLGAFTIFDSSAASIYHSLQTTATKRFSQGYQLTAAYTWSHAIDDVSDVFDVAGAFVLPQDDRALQLERGNANFDIRHRLAMSLIGNLPFTGRFNSAKGAKGAVLGGWQFSSLLTYQTGQPFTVNTGLDVNMDGNLTDRLHTLNGLTVMDDRRVKLQLETTSVNLLAPLGSNGRIGRNTFRASGVGRTDLAIVKNFQLGGSHYIVFRTEAFNLFNRTQFGVPVRILEAPSFGQSVDTQIAPRQIQFALKYVF